MRKFSDIGRATGGLIRTAPLGWYTPTRQLTKVDTIGCENCKEHCIVDQRIACQYCLRHEHSRGCPGGSRCTKYDPIKLGKRKAGEVDPSVYA